MKKLFITSSLILALGMNCYAQKDVKDDELTYSCDELLRHNPDSGTITLVGNANLKTTVFEFQNADEIIINKASKEIIIKGGYKVIFNGGQIQQVPEVKRHQLRYKLSEKVAYIE